MSTTHEILLEAKALCAWYGAAQILYDVDLEVRRGEVVALMGRNGAGKSTTLKALIGMLTKQLVVDRGMAVLFTEHSMDVVFAYADRMIVLARGRLIAQGKPLEIRDHPKVQEVYFGSGKTFEKIAAKAAALGEVA